MTRNGILTRMQAWVEALRDPAPMIDHGVAILVLALLLCVLLGSVTFAAERGALEQRPTCSPDLSMCCEEPLRNPDCIPAYRRHEMRASVSTYRVVAAG